MLIRILICIILLVIGHKLFAQDRPIEKVESPPSARKVSHYVGLQANQLLRQLISFGNAAPTTNPYVLTYSAVSRESGVGFSTGLGVSSVVSKTTDNFVSAVSTVTDFSWRAGLEKKKYLSRYWLVGIGGDFVTETHNAETRSQSGGGSDIIVSTKSNLSGLGPRVSLAFQFHDRLMVGTEAAYYLKWGSTKTNNGTSGPPEPSADIRSHNFSLPAVIFLTMKFN